MPLILAIEPDRRQAAQLSVVVRKRVNAELILVETTERALDAIGNRMPDLVLVPALLSPQDDAALAAALRVIAAAARVQMLTIPVLGAPRPAAAPGGMLSALRRKPKVAEPDGCDPAVFAEQIASYLERAAQDRPSEFFESAVPESPARESLAPERAAEIAEWESAVPENPVPESAAPDMAAWSEPAIERHVFEAIAAVEHTSGTFDDASTQDTIADHAITERAVTESAVNQEWLEPLPVHAVQEGEEPDESVSFAVEEAVRALFADPAPAAFEPVPEIVAPVETLPERPVAAAAGVVQDEWVAVEELMAALQLMPLAAIEITDGDDWIAPVLDEPQRVAAKQDHRMDEPETDDIDRSKDLRHGSGQPPAPAAGAASPAPVAAKSEREWVALIESLRHDVERLRVERSEKPGRKVAAATAAAAAAATKPARPERAAKPVQDEWGFFDPEQCGFAALLAKLDEVTDSDDGRINH